MSTGIIAVNDIATAGAIVWWRLSGDTNVSAIEEAWLASGLDRRLLPAPPSSAAAASRACSEQVDKDRFIRSIPAKAGASGWAVVDQVISNGALDYKVVAKVRTSAQGITIEPDSNPLAEKLKADYQIALARYTINDISGWLTKLVFEAKAVSLRDTGGVYFVPKEGTELFRKMVDVLQNVSHHQVFEVPALKSEEAVEAILDAVTMEATKEARVIETELDTGNIKHRALGSREKKVKALQEKIETYERLLGRNLGEIKDRMLSLQAGIVAAKLTFESAQT